MDFALWFYLSFHCAFIFKLQAASLYFSIVPICSHYYVSVPGADRLVTVAHQNVARSLGEPSEVGRPVWLSWRPEVAILLSE